MSTENMKRQVLAAIEAAQKNPSQESKNLLFSARQRVVNSVGGLRMCHPLRETLWDEVIKIDNILEKCFPETI